MDEKYGVLKRYFGYDQFREGQETLIDAILAGRDAVGIMPTGAGKSLCFQIPALLLEGITLVVSPLISLMKDQVGALTQAGVPAAFLNSSLTEAQFGRALDNARAGCYKILYIAPERLLTESFLAFAQSARVALLAVDEAHCVSQWGQDFRPSYLQIREFVEALPTRPVVGAFTATATLAVREDIVRMLSLEEPEEVVTGFDRVNLYYEVRQDKDKRSALLSLMERFGDRSGIVYCATRKSVEEVCALLEDHGVAATRYHAGLPDVERRENQDDFLFDRKRVMVATNAFGMGIDKSNVGFVVHYNMPKDLESYYQEAGRAGRDGSPADCVLLYSGQDVVTNRFLLEHAHENDQLDEASRAVIRDRDAQRLRAMTFYCHSRDCLRHYILRYFGEQSPTYCGNCYNCLHNFEETDVTIEAQKILSCVKRTGERYGIGTIVEVLRGAKTERMARLGMERQTTYGLMKDLSETRVREIINYLVLNGSLVQSEGQYPVLSLGEPARGVLFRGERAVMKTVKEEAPKPKAAPKAKAVYTQEQPGLFGRLRTLRAEIAKEQGVPAFIVFTDAALHDMAARAPQNREEFLEVSGVGQKKLEQYGGRFLAAIADWREANGED